MMAELIVTKKEIGSQLQKSTGTSRARPKSPVAGGQQSPLGEDFGPSIQSFGFVVRGRFWGAGFAASAWTPAEGKIGVDTAAWIRVIQGHSQDRRHGNRQRSGPAGLDMTSVA